ncbi:MAG: DinB family protein [Armatimonadetes bacterium]|nr:DinB family protein [Armatimonadota bacterium]
MENANPADIRSLEGMHRELGLLLAVLQAGTMDWRKELGEVSDESVVWQPFAGGHSIGLCVLHLADAESYWIETVAAGRERDEQEIALLLSRETQQYSVKWPDPPRLPLPWFYEQQDKIRDRTIETVRSIGDPDSVGRREKDGETYTFTLRWILQHLIAHESHHGGQAVLLKLMHDKRAESG